ncbi:hypothetical protein SAMN05421839_10969 [Halolactibacillus halophilus]|uniref:Uncharacterized protein n=1 Tax=Halolactibacillus halophilus TaxID=306540 RepID=A0A1I5NIP4_9BACI|nr:hypothetical protein [Halolactibacillus halophilus]GEM01356.1 hypothetical protein HHA03_08880 [Halolactibacillus halophilus]SFP21654.1 hypothetical protein SAMN05421839_10969 [Halolactibacillus halophilus]
MTKTLQEVLMEYPNQQQFLNRKVHVKGTKNGEIVFNDYCQVTGTIEPNYSRLTITWPFDNILPVNYRDYYSPKKLVEFKYFEKEDKVQMSGDYNGSYIVEVQLPSRD